MKLETVQAAFEHYIVCLRAEMEAYISYWQTRESMLELQTARQELLRAREQFHRLRSAYAAEQRAPMLPRAQIEKKVTVKCARAGCTQTRTAYKTQLQNSKLFFCSRECYHLFRIDYLREHGVVYNRPDRERSKQVEPS